MASRPADPAPGEDGADRAASVERPAAAPPPDAPPLLPPPDPPPQRPRMRGELVALAAEADGQSLVVLRDPLGCAPEAVLPAPMLALLRLFDGKRTLDEIAAELCRRTGQLVPREKLAGVVRDLDENHFLDSPAYARLKAAPLRPARHAGGAYAADPAELRAQLDALFTHPEGPGARPAALRPAPDGDGRLTGLISPHIDLHRGGPCYAWAYKELAERADTDLFVLFGTCHAPAPGLFALTRKDYDTPLGTVTTDRAFVDAVIARCPQTDLLEGELAHLAEHSLEFQALFLQYLYGGKRPFTVVPILVTSFHQFVESGCDPATAPEVAAFVAAVRAVAAGCGKRVAFVCGADLAHMGPQFGDEAKVTAPFLAELAGADRAMLAAVESGDAGAFFRSIAAEQDRRKVCGFPPIWTMMAVLGGARGRVLDYRQWADLAEGSGTVTFAAVAFGAADGAGGAPDGRTH